MELDIASCVEEALEKAPRFDSNSLGSILEAAGWAEKFVEKRNV